MQPPGHINHMNSSRFYKQVARQLVMVTLTHEDMQHSPFKSAITKSHIWHCKKKITATGLLMLSELEELYVYMIITSEQI
jgi:ssDNA-specific exonuclease RecJ